MYQIGSDVQRQTAVPAYLKSNQLLLFVFALQSHDGASMWKLLLMQN